MELILRINKEDKVFTTPFVSGMVLRKYIELLAKTTNAKNLTVEEMDEYVGLVVLAFENQFTIEEYYNGISQDKVMTTVDSLFIPEPDNDGGTKKK